MLSLSFKSLATATACVTLALGVANVAAGSFVVGRWGIEGSEGVLLLARRIGALYLGLAVIFVAARAAAPSRARWAIGCGTGIACALLSGLGALDLLAGRATAGILPSVVVEALLSLGYLSLVLRERSQFTQ